MKTYLVNIDELWLKGRNRKYYFNSLKSQIKIILKEIGLTQYSLENQQQRLVI